MMGVIDSLLFGGGLVMKTEVIKENNKNKRRIAAEQAIRYRGYDNMKDCARACERLARQKGESITFNDLSIQQFITCNTNLSLKRLFILAELLNINDYKQLNEAYTPPNPRGVGKDWVGEHGSVVKDYDASNLII